MDSFAIFTGNELLSHVYNTGGLFWLPGHDPPTWGVQNLSVPGGMPAQPDRFAGQHMGKVKALSPLEPPG